MKRIRIVFLPSTMSFIFISLKNIFFPKIFYLSYRKVFWNLLQITSPFKYNNFENKEQIFSNRALKYFFIVNLKSR